MRSVFYNKQINKLTPHFTFMHWAQNADTHPLKQHRLSQNTVPPSAPWSLYWLVHLTCISSLKAKNIDFHTAKNIHIQATLFLYFQTNSYKLTSDLFVVVWPVLSGRNFETAAEQRAQEAGKRLFHQAVGKVTGISEPRGEPPENV